MLQSLVSKIIVALLSIGILIRKLFPSKHTHTHKQHRYAIKYITITILSFLCHILEMQYKERDKDAVSHKSKSVICKGCQHKSSWINQTNLCVTYIPGTKYLLE